MKLNLNFFSIHLLISWLFFFQLGCAPGTEKEHKQPQAEESLAAAQPTSPNLYAYWDGYDFTDVTSLQDPEQTEQRLVDFLARLPQYDQASIDEAFMKLMQATSVNPKVKEYFQDKLAFYLYHPNSPARNEIYYESVLKAILADTNLVAVQRDKYTQLLKLVQLNKPGEAVQDFRYYTAAKESAMLSESHGVLRLLIFHDLTCSHCAEVIKELAQLPALNHAIAQQKLKVIAIEPLADFAAWKAARHKIPDNWVNAVDKEQNIVKHQLFNLRAYPSLYVLDPAGTVILRDADALVVLNYLAKLL